MDKMYGPVYRNLEKEFLKIADYVHVSDEQLTVYSMHIADLIVRCAIEIESISKELYCRLGGNMTPVDDEGKNRDLYFDTDCLQLLENTWLLSKKKINVCAITVYLVDEDKKVFTPLHKSFKRGTSGSKWKQAYQALKHDRRNAIKQATIGNLLSALGALYILNLYYKDETANLGWLYMNNNDFDNRAGSEIFSAYVYRATMLQMNTHMNDDSIGNLGDVLEEAVFIKKYDDKTFKEMHKAFCLDNAETMKRFGQSPEIQKYMQEHSNELEGKTINQICLAAGGEKLLTRIVSFGHAMKDNRGKAEVILNKHAKIYPELFAISE